MWKSPQQKDFVLDCFTQQAKLQDYDSLSDKNLRGYFANRRMMKHLIKTGILTKTGEFKNPKSARLWESPQGIGNLATQMVFETQVRFLFQQSDYTNSRKSKSKGPLLVAKKPKSESKTEKSILKEKEKEDKEQGKEKTIQQKLKEDSKNSRKSPLEKPIRSTSQQPKINRKDLNVKPMEANEYLNLLNEYKSKIVQNDQVKPPQQKKNQNSVKPKDTKKISEKQVQESNEQIQSEKKKEFQEVAKENIKEVDEEEEKREVEN